jgi:hypothetical protein
MVKHIPTKMDLTIAADLASQFGRHSTEKAIPGNPPTKQDWKSRQSLRGKLAKNIRQKYAMLHAGLWPLRVHGRLLIF